jgi:hypothetical protein
MAETMCIHGNPAKHCRTCNDCVAHAALVLGQERQMTTTCTCGGNHDLDARHPAWIRNPPSGWATALQRHGHEPLAEDQRPFEQQLREPRSGWQIGLDRARKEGRL